MGQLDYITKCRLRPLVEEAILKDPWMQRVNGVLLRAPHCESDGVGEVVFWEPVVYENGYPAGWPEQIADELRPLRVQHATPTNASYSYHDIRLNSWPDHRPLRVRGNEQNGYNRLRRQCEGQEASWRQLDAIEIEDLIRHATEYWWATRDATDLCAILNSLYAPDGRYEWWQLALGDGRYARFLLRRVNGQSVWSTLVLLDRESVASTATWHLCNKLASEGVVWLDIWNVGVTRREQYKRLFFTHARTRRCYYMGHNPYPWLQKD